MWEERLNGDGGKGMVASRLKAHLPNRLAEALVREAGLEERRVSELRKAERVLLLQLLTEYELQYTGHQGYKKAEVRQLRRREEREAVGAAGHKARLGLDTSSCAIEPARWRLLVGRPSPVPRTSMHLPS